MSNRRQDRRRSWESLHAVAILGISMGLAVWAIVHLFPTELRQTGEWLKARYQALVD